MLVHRKSVAHLADMFDEMDTHGARHVSLSEFRAGLLPELNTWRGHVPSLHAGGGAPLRSHPVCVPQMTAQDRHVAASVGSALPGDNSQWRSKSKSAIEELSEEQLTESAIFDMYNRATQEPCLCRSLLHDGHWRHGRRPPSTLPRPTITTHHLTEDFVHFFLELLAEPLFEVHLEDLTPLEKVAST